MIVRIRFAISRSDGAAVSNATVSMVDNSNNLATQGDFDAIQQRVRKEVDTATDEAEKSPMPNPSDAALGVFGGDGYWG